MLEAAIQSFRGDSSGLARIIRDNLRAGAGREPQDHTRSERGHGRGGRER